MSYKTSHIEHAKVHQWNLGGINTLKRPEIWLGNLWRRLSNVNGERCQNWGYYSENSRITQVLPALIQQRNVSAQIQAVTYCRLDWNCWKFDHKSKLECWHFGSCQFQSWKLHLKYEWAIIDFWCNFVPINHKMDSFDSWRCRSESIILEILRKSELRRLLYLWVPELEILQKDRKVLIFWQFNKIGLARRNKGNGGWNWRNK